MFHNVLMQSSNSTTIDSCIAQHAQQNEILRWKKVRVLTERQQQKRKKLKHTFINRWKKKEKNKMKSGKRKSSMATIDHDDEAEIQAAKQTNKIN